MANLEFRYGAMNSGKSSLLMQTAYNYEENNKKVLVIKSLKDTKAGDMLESRIGLKRKVDILLPPEDSLVKYYKYINGIVDCIFVDEAQFLTESQVEELWYISKMFDIPVICYGLKADFQSHLFPGSKRIIELADVLIENSTMCKCGELAKFNARFVDNEFTLEGEEVVIDGSDENITYKPMCGRCYIKKTLALKSKK